jgi:hypothetical protein
LSQRTLVDLPSADFQTPLHAKIRIDTRFGWSHGLREVMASRATTLPSKSSYTAGPSSARGSSVAAPASSSSSTAAPSRPTSSSAAAAAGNTPSARAPRSPSPSPPLRLHVPLSHKISTKSAMKPLLGETSTSGHASRKRKVYWADETDRAEWVKRHAYPGVHGVPSARGKSATSTTSTSCPEWLFQNAKAVPFDFVSLAKSTYNRVPGDLISEEEIERREEVLRRLVVSP